MKPKINMICRLVNEKYKEEFIIKITSVSKESNRFAFRLLKVIKCLDNDKKKIPYGNFIPSDTENDILYALTKEEEEELMVDLL
jgi:hypothetical protein